MNTRPTVYASTSLCRQNGSSWSNETTQNRDSATDEAVQVETSRNTWLIIAGEFSVQKSRNSIKYVKRQLNKGYVKDRERERARNTNKWQQSRKKQRYREREGVSSTMAQQRWPHRCISSRVDSTSAAAASVIVADVLVVIQSAARRAHEISRRRRGRP